MMKPLRPVVNERWAAGLVAAYAPSNPGLVPNLVPGYPALSTVNAPTVGATVYGPALRCVSASSQYAEFDHAPVTNHPLTLVAVCIPATIQSQRVIGVYDASAVDQWACLTMNVDGDAEYRFRDTTSNITIQTSTSVFEAGKLAVWAGVSRGNNDHVLYDLLPGYAEQRGTSAVAFDPTGIDRTSLGRAGDSSPEDYFDGDILAAYIWNRGLSVGELDLIAQDPFAPIRPYRTLHFFPQYRYVVPGRRR